MVNMFTIGPILGSTLAKGNKLILCVTNYDNDTGTIASYQRPTFLKYKHSVNIQLLRPTY